MKKKHIIKNEEGSALIPVLCILCILAAFVLALVLASYQVLTQAQRAATKEQCRLSAITLSDQIRSELEAEEEEDSTALNEIQQYLYDSIYVNKSWKYYNEKEEQHSDKIDTARTLTFDTKSGSETWKYTGEPVIKMYWESNEEDQKAGKYENIVLVVKVTSTLRGQKYTVTTQYELKKPNTEGTDWSKTENWKWAHSWSGN